LVQPLIDRFEEESGIDVEVRYAGSTDLAATLLQEGSATDADVFYAQDPASLGSVASLMTRLDNALLDLVEPKYADREGRWIGTSGRVRVFVHNTGTDLALPRTIDEVNDPAWAGQIGIAPTNGSFLAFVSAMILERGEEATLEWLEDLVANQPQQFGENGPIVAATDAGEIMGGLVNHYYLLRLRAEGAGQDAENWYIPAGDVGTLVMPAGAGVLTTSDVPDAAREFVEFLLTEPAQEYFATETFEYPLIDGIELGDGAPSISDLNTPDIDLSQLADVLDDATRLVTEAGLV
jgi:iron(III) transport system substrate-binding protein